MRFNHLLILSSALFLYGFTSHDRLSEIELAVMQNNFPAVEEQAQNLLSQNPDKSTLWKAKYYLGLSQLKQKKYAQAREAFHSLLGKDVDAGWRDKAYLGLADASFLEEQYEEALPVLQKLLKSNPQTPFKSLTYLKIARVHLKLAHWDDAHTYLKKVIDEYPQSLEVATAQQFLEEKQYFAVQVGSFLDRQRAEGLVAELNVKDEYAYIVETVDHQNKKFFRVRVGQLAYLDEARSLQERLSRKGYPTQIFP
jgi:tetratricopeptide (TPR) repeat protein